MQEILATYDSEFVTINTELKVSIDSNIDETNQVFLSLFKKCLVFRATTNTICVCGGGAIESVGAVDQAVLESWGCASDGCSSPERKDRTVSPILEE
jgi:hypothetical protein